MSGGEGEADDRAAVRRTILLLSVSGFASALSSRFVDPMIGAIARDLAADPLRVALLSSAFALPYAFVQPILGPLGDALGKERIIKVVLVGLAVVLAACSLVGGLGPLFVCRVLSGAFAGGVIPLGLATIGDRVVMAERQVAIGRFLTATISGQLLGGAVGGFLADIYGWRGAFMAAALVSAVAAGAVSLGFRRSSVAVGRFSVRTALDRYRQIFGIGRARALMAFVFVEAILVAGLFPYLGLLLEEAGLGGPKEAGLVLAGFAVGGIVYTLLVRLLLRLLGLRRMLMGGGLVIGLAYGLLTPTLAWPWQALTMMIVGVGFYMLHNSFQTQMTEVAPQARGSAVALHAFSFFVGQSIGPVVIGFLLASFGRAGALLVCAAGAVALGLVASRILGGPPLRREVPV